MTPSHVRLPLCLRLPRQPGPLEAAPSSSPQEEGKCTCGVWTPVPWHNALTSWNSTVPCSPPKSSRGWALQRATTCGSSASSRGHWPESRWLDADCNGEIHPRHIQFIKNAWGKPEVALPQMASNQAQGDGAPEPLASLCFNLSHTRGLIAMAVASNAQVGLDVEDCSRMCGRNAMLLARRRFSPEEAQWLASLPSTGAREAAVVQLWTLKEAVVKALGLGMAAMPFRTFSILGLPCPPPPGEHPLNKPASIRLGTPLRMPSTVGCSLSDTPNPGPTAPAPAPASVPANVPANVPASVPAPDGDGVEQGLQLVLLRPRDGFVMALCVGTAQEQASADESLGGPSGAAGFEGSAGVRVKVFWTVPLDRDLVNEEGAHQVLAASEGTIC